MRLSTNRGIWAWAWTISTVLVTSCALASPPATRPSAPPAVQPTPAGEAPLQNLNLVVHDPRGIGIPQAICRVQGEARTADGAGFINFAVSGSVIAECQAQGYVARTIDLPPGDHRIPLQLAGQPQPPPAAPSGHAPWDGRLTIAPGQAAFIDASQRYILPTCAHFGEAFSAFANGKAEPVRTTLLAVKAAGYDCIRFWDTLGYYQMVWKGREIMPWPFAVCTASRWAECDGHTQPETPNYYTKLREFLELLRTIGLSAHHSRGDLNGRRVEQVVEHAQRVVNLYDQVGWPVLALAEGNNEDFQNGDFGPEGLRRITDPFRQHGALVASSCPAGCSEEPEDILAYARWPTWSVTYIHGFRAGAAWDRLRHIFSLGYELPSGAARLLWQGEPTGPGSGVTVGNTASVEELGLLAFQAWMTRQAWVYMSSCGVFYTRNDGTVCRLEDEPGFATVPKLRDVLYAFAPDVMTWNRIYHGSRTEARLTSPTGYVYAGGAATEGPARIDQVISPDGKKVVAIVYGGKGRKQVTNGMGCAARWMILKPEMDGVRQDPIDVPAGSAITFEYEVGRAILAECKA